MKYFFDFHEIPYYRCHLSNFFMNSFQFEENVDQRAKFRKYILNLGYIEHQPDNQATGMRNRRESLKNQNQSKYCNNF